MAQSKLDIIIAAQNKTGAELSKLSKDLGSLNDRLDRNQSASKGAATSAKGMFTTFTAAGVAVQAITAGFQGLTQGIKSSIQESNRLNNSLTGLNTIATAFGQDAEGAKRAAQSLAADGLMTVADAATGLKNLLAAGFSLDHATQLMLAFKDSAAFGRQSALQFGQAIAGATEGIKNGNSILVDNAGVTKNLSMILEEAGYSAQDLMKASSDAGVRQAIFNGILRETSPMLGDAARLSNSYAGEQARAAAESRTLSATIGDALQPAVSILNQGLIGLMRQGTASASSGMQNLQGSIVALMAVARAAGEIVLGSVELIISAIQSALALSWDPLERSWDNASNRLVNTAIDMQKGFEKIARGTADTQISEQVRAADGMVDANKGAAQKMTDDIEEANRRFSRSQEQRLKQFQESLKDMIISHRDKSKELQKDLASEDAAFAKSVKRREQDYTKDLADLEERHKDKVADITEEITKEKNSGLVVDGVLYRQANQQKIADLEEQLAEEKSKHRQALAERKRQYEQDAADDKARHEERRTRLQTELDEELSILKKHKDDVKAVGDAQKEDDISRLKRQFAEANALSERDHQENLVKIRQRGSQQGTTFGGAFAGAAKPGTDQVKRDVDRMLNEIKPIASAKGREAGKHWWDAFKDTLGSWFSGFPRVVGDWIRNGVSSIQAKVEHSFSGPLSGFGNLLSEAIRSISGRASGGSVRGGQAYWVGENRDGSLNRTSELFVPNQSGQILNQQQIQQAVGSGSGQSVTIGSVHLHNQTDTAAFLREIAFELN